LQEILRIPATAAKEALLVEFSDAEGQTCAMADLKPDQLLVLHRRTQPAQSPLYDFR